MFKKNDQIKLKQHRYKIIDELDAGGQSRVWTAYRLSDNKKLVIKSVNLYTDKGRTSRRPVRQIEQLAGRLT